MKKIMLLLLLTSSFVFAQESVSQVIPKGVQTHDGLFLSLTSGAAIGPIAMEATNGPFKKMEFSGAGYQVDFKIGSVISEEESLCLSFDLIARTISSPSLTMDGKSVNATSSIDASDLLYGVGITKYFMPDNIFISATLGIGEFSLYANNSRVTSKSGFAFQLKGGKEWWVSDNWGLGVAIGLGYAAADDQSDPAFPNYSGKLSTTKFFLVFNTTFN